MPPNGTNILYEDEDDTLAILQRVDIESNVFYDIGNPAFGSGEGKLIQVANNLPSSQGATVFNHNTLLNVANLTSGLTINASCCGYNFP